MTFWSIFYIFSPLFVTKNDIFQIWYFCIGRAETYSFTWAAKPWKTTSKTCSCFFMWCWRKITENVSHVISTRISPTLTTFCNIKLYFHHFSSFQHKTVKKITLFTVDPSKRIFIKNEGQNFHIIKVWTCQKSCWL